MQDTTCYSGSYIKIFIVINPFCIVFSHTDQPVQPTTRVAKNCFYFFVRSRTGNPRTQLIGPLFLFDFIKLHIDHFICKGSIQILFNVSFCPEDQRAEEEKNGYSN